ncbi:MAG: glycosyltransferase family 4 protein [Bacillota bacterium]
MAKEIIAIVTPGDDPLPPARCSSVDIYDYHLGRALASRAPVMLFARGASGKTLQRAGMTIAEIPVRGSGPVYLRHVLRRSAGRRYRVIQIDNRPRYATSLRRRFPHTPIVINMHSVNFLAPRLITRSEVVRSFSAANVIVANSRYVRRELIRRFPRFTRKYRVVLPGVDLSLFPARDSQRGQTIRLAMRRQYRITPNKTVLLLVGRFLPRKGVTVLLRALRQLRAKHPNLILWVVGGKPFGASSFHRQVRKLARSLPVRFFPFVSSRQVHRYYLAADLLVCPSQLPEAFGMVNVEAAATGLPAVGSDAWGIKESIIPGVSGWRVRNFRSSRAWSSTIARLLAQRDQRLAIGKRAHKMAVSRYSWHRVASQFTSLYRSL